MASRELSQTASGAVKPTKPSEVLDAAADLLTSRGAWTQGAASRDATGEPDDDISLLSNATCWCAWGAMLAVCGESRIVCSGLPGRAFDFLQRHLKVDHIPDWNDRPSRTKAQVVSALRGAADLAKETGQ